MESNKAYLIELSTEETKQIKAGGWVGATAGAAAALLAAAYYIGYSDGKDDCLPPPCE
ncbi:MAG: hypothetical protein WEA56_12815 [Balneolaceae bacterium]